MRRRMISVAVSHFGDSALATLPFARDRQNNLVASLVGHGYELIGGAPVVDPTAVELADRLHEAVVSASPDDLVVVHILSHGRYHNRTVQVYGSDGQASARTALDTWLLQASDVDEAEGAVGEPGGGPYFLFLVDVCGAGQAARQPWQADIADERRRAWVIAGCLPDRPGFDGRFTRAAATIFADTAPLDIHPSSAQVPLTAIARAIRQEVHRLAASEHGYDQTVVATRVDMASALEFPPFFDNPRYRRSIAGLVPGHLREFAATVEDLFDAWHFVSRAAGRGPQDHDLTGGSFRGRRTQLRRLRAWLDGAAAGGLYFVTGSPGVGKSALVGMVVCAAHPLLRDATKALWAARTEDLPDAVPGLAAVHARELDLSTVLGQLAGQLGFPEPDRAWTLPVFIWAARQRPGPPVLVVDAVDEATDPGALAANLSELAEATRADGTAVFRMLIGARSGVHWPSLDPLLLRARADVTVLDLDEEPRDQLRVDLHDYVEDLLRTHPTYESPRQADVRTAFAAGIAGRLAEPPADDGQPRWGEFLVAGLFVNHVLGQPAAGTPIEASVRAVAVPRSLPEVLALDLVAQSRHPWLYPVLTTLAHSFGGGLPRTLIRACAPVFAGQGAGSPTESDIVGVLEQARFYLRRDVDANATAVYRLFHQALTDHLRAQALALPTLADGRRVTPVVIHLAIYERLLADAKPDPTAPTVWDPLVGPYLRRHLIDHAAAADRVASLLADPEFLVYADPGTLPRHLHRADAVEARLAAAVYRTSYPRHRQLAADPAARRGLLALDAARHGAIGLADRLVAPPRRPALPWRPAWATGASITNALRHTLVGHTGAVHAVVCARVGDADVCLSASEDATVRVWDLADGSLRFVLSGHSAGVRAIACTRLSDGTHVAVSGSADGTARVWDLADGRLRAVLTGPGRSIRGVVCGRLPDGVDVCLSTGADGQVWVWDLATGQPLRVHEGVDVHELAVATVDGRIVAAVGAGRTVWAWDFRRSVEPEVLGHHERAARVAACGRTQQGSLVAITAGVDAVAKVWRLDGPPERDLAGHAGTIRAVALARFAGADVALTGSRDGTAGVWDLANGGLLHRLLGHSDAVVGLACVQLAEGTDIAVTASADGTARVWEFAYGDLRQQLSGHSAPITALDVTRIADGTDIATTGSEDATVRVWDLSVPLGRVHVGHSGQVGALASSRPDPERQYVFSGGTEGQTNAWDLATGSWSYGDLGAGDAVVGVAVVVLDDAPDLVVTACANGTLAVRGVGLDGVRHDIDARLDASSSLAAARLVDGTAVAVTTGRRESVARVWHLVDGTLARLLTGYLAPSSPLALTRLADGTDVLVARSRHGTARVWHPLDGTIRPGAYGHRLAERRPILTTRLGDGRDVAVTTGDRRVVIVWRLDDGELLHTLAAGEALATGCLSDGTDVGVATTPEGGTVVWHLADGTVRHVFAGHTGPVRAACVASGDFVLTAGADATVRVWSLGDGREAQVLALPDVPRALHVAPDGSVIVGFGAEVARLVPYGAREETA